jgi:hypothetical protein
MHTEVISKVHFNYEEMLAILTHHLRAMMHIRDNEYVESVSQSLAQSKGFVATLGRGAE